MAITNGQIANADEVMNAMGEILNIASNNIWNSALIGHDTNYVEDLEKYVYDTIQDTTKIDETNSDYKNYPIYGGNVLDEFEDASIDANIWSTSGIVSESNGTLIVGYKGTTGDSYSGVATANGTNAINFRNDGYVLLATYDSERTTSTTCNFEITNNSTSVAIYSVPTGASKKKLRLEFSATNNNVVVYADDLNGEGTPTATVDLSSVGTNWYLKMNTATPSGSTTLRSSQIILYDVKYIPNSNVSNDFISTSFTSSETITNAIHSVSENTDFGSISYYLSADGTNYISATPNEITRFTNTGTSLKFKATLTTVSGKVPILNHYAIKYNLY